MRNEERYIGACLESVLANDFPCDDYEVIVIDGASTDRSREIVEKIARDHGSVRVVENPEQIVPTGLNAGISEARGRYIIRMDAHSQYPADYIRQCVAELERTGADVVGGTMTTKPGAPTTLAQAIALMSTHKFGVGNSGFRIGWMDRYVDTVPFGAFRREVFQRVGFFRSRLVRNQDFEMAARIRANGGKIFLSSKIRLTYHNVPTVTKFVHQARKNGLWLGRCWLCYPASFAMRHAVPVAFVTTLAVSLLASVFLPAAALVTFAVLAAYAVTAIAAATQIARSNGLKYLFIMPWLFFSYHVTYGLSTMAGLATAWKAKEKTIPAEHVTASLCGAGRAAEGSNNT
jgi:glycosyltransferase involved in cell wall biosynthesis